MSSCSCAGDSLVALEQITLGKIATIFRSEIDFPLLESLILPP